MQVVVQRKNNNPASTMMAASYEQNEEGGNEDEARESGHAMPPQGLNTVHATTRAQSAMLTQNNHKKQ